MAGIIGAALAGAAQGAGTGLAAVGKEWSASVNEDLKQEAMDLRAQNLARINNAAAQGRVETQETGATGRTTAEIGAREREGAANREANVNLEGVRSFNAQALEGVRQDYERSRDAANRDLTREEIASRERTAAANNATSLKVASMGGTVQPDKDGNILFFDRAGNPKQIMDPNNPGQPLKGQKDLTPAAKAYVDTIKAQLVDLDRSEAAASGDQAQLSSISSRRVALMRDQLNVLTGGISAANTAPAGAAPTPEDISGLKQRSGNPAAVSLFENKYGRGSAQQYLTGGAAKAVATFKDPLNGEEISADQWKKRYGEPPKRTQTEMTPY